MTGKETTNTDKEPFDWRLVDGDVRMQGSPGAMKVCIIGASGKLGR
jgi:hypothetical protein